MSRNKQASANRTTASPNVGPAAQILHESTCSPSAAEPRGEERISVFWRVFGGTLLSIAALVVMTVYQQFSSNLNDLRAAISHVTENQVDMVKKEDLAGRTGTLWASVQSINGDMPAVKTRLAVVENQLQASEKQRHDLERQVQTLRERLVVLEAPPAAGAASGISSTSKLPSVRRFDGPPQYFPPLPPDFPLARELAAQETTSGPSPR